MSSTRRRDLGRGQGDVLEAEGEVFFDRRPDELVVGVLEQHADVATHRGVALGARKIVPADQRPCGVGRPRQATEQAGERGLARAVGADHRDELAALDDQVDAAQGVVGGAGVAEPQPLDVDQRHALTPECRACLGRARPW